MCNIRLYSTSELMHIVRYVFIRKIYDGSSPAVALSRFDFFNCQAVTTVRFFFSFADSGSRLGDWIWTTFTLFFFFFPPSQEKLQHSKKGEKRCERQFKASSITLAWPMLPCIESFMSLGKPMTIKVLSIQWQCWTWTCSHCSAVT